MKFKVYNKKRDRFETKGWFIDTDGDLVFQEGMDGDIIKANMDLYEIYWNETSQEEFY